jgi:hypothetical protein
MATALSHDAFSFVNAFARLPSLETRTISGGALIVDLAKTTKPLPGLIDPIEPWRCVGAGRRRTA